jgi:hypothetical protein
LGTVCMAKPLRGKELPGASWLWKITWSPANSLLPWQPRKMGNLSLIHPLCLASWQGYAHSAASGLLWRMPCVPQETQMNGWYDGHTVFSNIIT